MPTSKRTALPLFAGFALCLVAGTTHPAKAQNYNLVGWNNLGMHCMDGDFSVFSLLPPYNTIHCQLIDPQGHLVANPAGIRVTYQAVADPAGSINTTSAGKTDFWSHVQALFGASPPVDVGLTGLAMPGASNQPRPMSYDPIAGWFIAEGIPITPYDDAHQKNSYPMLRLVARDSVGTLLASADIVVPVSDEMDCVTCHSSGASSAAQPNAGWVNDPDPQRDFRLNVLRRHDDRRGADPAFQAAAVVLGYNSAGLYATATDPTNPKSILCAACHASAALGTAGQPGAVPLTQAVHGMHANVTDPITGLLLESANNRSACYRCHPGSVTRCLRGVMGAAVAADGTLAMQCQSCHGSMSAVASPTRTGWLNEPVCQSCHTGTALSNSGQLRYESAFDTPGHARVAVDRTFATTADVPAAGLSLFRFSKGHGGLTCEACHGSTHAEFPTVHPNDNVESIAMQGHEGMLAECDSCHPSAPATVNGGPHGLHPLGQPWVNSHHDLIGEGGDTNACRACHGLDYRGTALSRVKGDRIVNGEFGTKQLWRGFQVGCYTCHLGPINDNTNPNHAAVASNASASTVVNRAISIRLTATDADQNPLTLRVVSQPDHGTAGLNGTLADYFPEPGFAGVDRFTFAAWDGSTDSNLATVIITVNGGASVTPTNAVITPTPTRTPTPTATSAVSWTPTRTSTAATATPTQTAAWSVSGTVRYYGNGAPVNAATVEVLGHPDNPQTDSSGLFMCAGMNTGNYQLQPSKVGDVGAGITALDATYVLQAVVGLRSLSTEQRLAGDVNGSGTLSALDATLILQYRVGLISRFPVAQMCASDWTFIPTPAPAPNQQSMQPGMSPGSCGKGAIAFQPLVSSVTNQDFTAVLFGDCTGNWGPSLVARSRYRGVNAVGIGHVRRRGAYVYVPIVVTRGRSVTSLDMQVAYDPRGLAFNSARSSIGGGQALLAANERTAGLVAISLASPRPLMGSVMLLKFTATSGHFDRRSIRIVAAHGGE